MDWVVRYANQTTDHKTRCRCNFSPQKKKLKELGPASFQRYKTIREYSFFFCKWRSTSKDFVYYLRTIWRYRKELSLYRKCNTVAIISEKNWGGDHTGSSSQNEKSETPTEGKGSLSIEQWREAYTKTHLGGSIECKKPMPHNKVHCMSANYSSSWAVAEAQLVFLIFEYLQNLCRSSCKSFSKHISAKTILLVCVPFQWCISTIHAEARAPPFLPTFILYIKYPSLTLREMHIFFQSSWSLLMASFEGGPVMLHLMEICAWEAKSPWFLCIFLGNSISHKVYQLLWSLN